MTVYSLAEVLGKCVHELREMPTTEYFGWIAYFNEKARKREVEKGNLLAMDPDEMIKAATGDG